MAENSMSLNIRKNQKNDATINSDSQDWKNDNFYICALQ
jgi:hypothetical protein